jgi:F-type H+-transporting ATPase subunit b
MEQLIQSFGIDAKLIVAQIINFVILLALLSYFLYTPMLRLLKEREEKIAQGIKDAEAAAKAKATADGEKKAILTAAEQKAAHINTAATNEAAARGDEIVKEASLKAENILKAAESAGEQLKQKAAKEAEADVAKAALLAAERILREKAS